MTRGKQEGRRDGSQVTCPQDNLLTTCILQFKQPTGKHKHKHTRAASFWAKVPRKLHFPMPRKTKNKKEKQEENPGSLTHTHTHREGIAKKVAKGC